MTMNLKREMEKMNQQETFCCTTFVLENYLNYVKNLFSLTLKTGENMYV